MIVTHLKDPIYNLTVNLVLDCSWEEYVKVVKDNVNNPDIEETSPGTRGEFRAYSNSDLYFLYVKNKKNLDTLAHELIHLVQYMLQRRGVPLNFETTEVLAYHHAWWFESIRNILKTKKKK